MKKLFLLSLLLFAALGLATAASAGVREGAFTVTPFVGGYTFDGVQHVNTNVVSGLGLGYNMGKNWGAEAQMFYVPVNPAAAGSKTTNGYGARLELQYNFIPDSAVVPYLALGGGWMRLDSFNPANDDGTLDYGAGLKLFVTDSVALRGDARHIFSIHSPQGGAGDFWQNFQYTLGMSLQFGGKQAPAPVAAAEPTPPPQPAPAPVPVPVREEPAVQPVPAPAPVLVREEPAAQPVPAPAETPQPKEAEALPQPVSPAPPEAVAATPEKEAPVITAITVVPDGLQIVAQGEIGDYKVFTLSRPARLVIDISGARRGTNWAILPINRHGIAVVRTGQYPDHLRIVLDAAGSKLPPYRVVRSGDGLKVELKR